MTVLFILINYSNDLIDNDESLFFLPQVDFRIILFSIDKIITGASTTEAQIRVGSEIAEQIVNLVKPGTYETPLAEVTRILLK